MRKEIEVKAKIQDKAALVRALEKIGAKLSDPMTQDDTVFVKSENDFLDFKGKAFLRIRKSKGKAIFTVKKPASNALDRSERETEIAEPEEMRQAILLLGYIESVRVVKTRRKAHYRDYEICVDDVEGLGSFIEVEKLALETDDAGKIQDELFAFLETLGVKRADRVTQGYDILMHLKQKAGK